MDRTLGEKVTAYWFARRNEGDMERSFARTSVRDLKLHRKLFAQLEEDRQLARKFLSNLDSVDQL